MKKALVSFVAILILVGTMEASARGQTHIDTNISIAPGELFYGTVFPEEVLFRQVLIQLSSSFLQNPILNDVEYHIQQKVKPRDPVDALYCENNPSDLSRCYPMLCPYLSKNPDGTPANDTGVAAFHDATASSSVAFGRLAKSESDLQDNWTIDLHVPCFRGQCAQDNTVPKAYEADPVLEGELFGCDLEVFVDRISFFEQECTIGFWKNWNKHKTYTEAEIVGWLRSIDNASGWLVAEAGYSVNTSGMTKLINDSNSCNGALRPCAKKKFLAQYLATRLGEESGRKELQNIYPMSDAQQSYLGLTNPDSLSDIISAIESKLPESGINPTRSQFLLMQSLLDSMNNTGL